MERFAARLVAAGRIRNKQEPLVEAADKLSYKFSPPESLEREATRHAKEFDRDEGQVRKDILTLREQIWESHIKNPNRDDRQARRRLEFATELEAIAEKYSLGVAETVADVTMDIPYLVAPLNQSVPDAKVITCDELSFRRRLDAARDALTALSGDPEQLYEFTDSRGSLFTELKSRIKDHHGADSDTSSPEVSLPLVTMPANLSGEAISSEDDMNEQLSPIGQLINTAFNSIGTAGGVIYFTTHPDSPESTANWLVNPHIATEPVGKELTYEQLWTRTFVLENLCDQLDGYAHPHASPPEYLTNVDHELICPLCHVSPPHTPKCGGETCMYATDVAAARQTCDDLVEGLTSVYEAITSR
jgi:hypothetical protein